MSRIHRAMVGTNPVAETQRTVRSPGLDALRAGGALLVVLLHAAIPYLHEPMPGLAWPARSFESSALADATFWWVESFVMPLFFCLSGYGCWLSLGHRGPLPFLHARWKRLGAPLIGAGCVILPIELYLWIGGWVLSGELAAVKLRSLKLTGYYAQAWGLSHLWYLQYLLIISVGLGLLSAAKSFFRKPSKSTFFDTQQRSLTALQSLGAGGVLFTAVVATLTWRPEVVLEFQHGFIPDTAKLAYSAEFFLVGVLIARMGNHGFPKRTDIAALLFVLAMICSIGTQAVLHRTETLPSIAEPNLFQQRLFQGILLALTATCWTLACWSGALLVTRLPNTISRLAAASFWIYLVHHPVVAALEILFVRTNLPETWQFLLVGSLTLAVSWWSYHALVEGTFVDRFLNGQSSPAPQPAAEPTSIPANDRKAA